jgi:hypothetical protein
MAMLSPIFILLKNVVGVWHPPPFIFYTILVDILRVNVGSSGAL